MLRIPENLEAVEFTKYRPSKPERTKPRRIQEAGFLSAVRDSIRRSQNKKMGIIPEPFDTLRYVLNIQPVGKSPILLRVYPRFIVASDSAYSSVDSSLWELLESKVNKQKEAVKYSEKPHFHREY